MNKRDRIFSMIEGTQTDNYVPAAFFLHFDASCHRGVAAISKHLEYFEFTGMDLMKIQYEHHFLPQPEIVNPDDWKKVKKLDGDFFAEPLSVVKGIVKEAKGKAPVLATLYSPYMFAAQVSSRDLLKRHLNEDPEAVKIGLRAVVENVLEFVEGCIDAGVDGFYASTQGGEYGYLSTPSLFEEYIKPTDLAIWEVISASCDLNILHVCDYEGPYEGLQPFVDYPGDVVNTSLAFSHDTKTPSEISTLFKRPFMGGMDRHGSLADGPESSIESDAQAVLATSPKQFLLGADCTVPGTTPWKHLKTAIDCAHDGGRN